MWPLYIWRRILSVEEFATSSKHAVYLYDYVSSISDSVNVSSIPCLGILWQETVHFNSLFIILLSEAIFIYCWAEWEERVLPGRDESRPAATVATSWKLE